MFQTNCRSCLATGGVKSGITKVQAFLVTQGEARGGSWAWSLRRVSDPFQTQSGARYLLHLFLDPWLSGARGSSLGCLTSIVAVAFRPVSDPIWVVYAWKYLLPFVSGPCLSGARGGVLVPCVWMGRCRLATAGASLSLQPRGFPCTQRRMWMGSWIFSGFKPNLGCACRRCGL